MNSYYNDGMKYSGGFGGSDGLVLGNIAKAINFRTQIVRPMDDLFGYKKENGTFIGKLKESRYSTFPIAFLKMFSRNIKTLFISVCLVLYSFISCFSKIVSQRFFRING